MRNDEINKKFEDQDESLKGYVDLKLRAYTAKLENKLKPFIWMVNNPLKTVGALVVLFLLSAWMFHMVDFEKFLKNRTGIELIESP